jgi:uncharacterized protein (TIGR03000 family)
MTKRSFLGLISVSLALVLVNGGSTFAGLFRGPYDMSLGPYPYGQPWSYNTAYGYGLPMTPAGNIYTFPTNWDYTRTPPAEPGPSFRSWASRRVVPLYRPNTPPGAPVDPAPVVQAVDPNAVVVEAHVPAGAEIWFDGERTAQTGTDRVFTSPPLAAGQTYHYQVVARWTDNGRPVQQAQQLAVRAGDRTRITFPRPPAPAAVPAATRETAEKDRF